MKTVMTVVVTLLIMSGLFGGLIACANEDSSNGDTPTEPATQPQEQPTGTSPTPVPPTPPVQGAIEIQLRVGDTHTIILESNPTTGYQWQIGPEFDERLVELVEQSYEPRSDALGSGGQESFTFRALARGYLEFGINYARSWETQPIKSQRYIFNIGVDANLAEAMSEADARTLAASSECGQQGALKEKAFYNDWTGTWWIDLDVEKPGCYPACVVDVETGQTEINWRCTGALPPQ